MQQLVTPNLKISYKGGWCEKGVENAFGTNGVYTSAMVAYDNNVIHKETPPSGLYVPIYLDLPNGPRDKNGKTEGDVAISCPNGTVSACALAGDNIGLYIYPSLKAYIDDYACVNDGAIYKGWGEYVGKIKVIDTEDNVTTKEIISLLYRGLLGREVDDAGLNNVGLPVDVVITRLMQSPEFAQREAKLNVKPNIDKSSVLDYIKSNLK